MPASSHRRPKRAALLSSLRLVPPAPGVYRFHDIERRIIYVGKSVCLRDRVRTYFNGRPATPKLRRLRREIHTLDWQVTGSELEALLLESRLIKTHLPRFNTLLRAFRVAPYVRVAWQEEYPRLEITRQLQADGAEYFGPFRSRAGVEAAVKTLSDALGLRTCEVDGAGLARQRPCYRMELGTCCAPCRPEADPAEYRRRMASATGVLANRATSPLRELDARMTRAAENLQFETAARLRDAISAVRAMAGGHQALRSAVRRNPLLVACPAAGAEALVLFVFAGGRLTLQGEVPRAELCRRPACRAIARAVLAAAAAPPSPLPGGVLSPEALDEVQIISAWMRRRTREGTQLELRDEGGGPRREGALARWLSEAASETVSPPRSASPAPPDS